MSENDGVLELTESTFAAAVASGTSLVDFWAPWCGPCRMMGPVLHELAGQFGQELTVAKVNVDESPHLAAKFRVQSIPLLVILRDGEEVGRMVGLQPKEAIVRALALPV